MNILIMYVSEGFVKVGPGTDWRSGFRGRVFASQIC